MRKSHSYLLAALVSVILSVSGSVASADPTPAPSPSTSIETFRAAQEQFRRDRDLYFSALRDREVKMREINSAFKGAVDKVSADAKIALTSATTPDQKNSINTSRRAAIAAAIVARESAIVLLGALPTPPVEPMKPPKGAPFGMNEQKGKQKR
jgi:hypothetical protein